MSKRCHKIAFNKVSNGQSKLPNLSSIVTRNGRTKRATRKQDFTYSPDSSENEETQLEQGENTKEDPDFTLSTNQSSESDCNQSTHSLIYLDLRQAIVKISKKPLMDPSIEQDKHLEVKLKKLLGLLAVKRKLYNPSNEDDCEPPPRTDSTPPVCIVPVLVGPSVISPVRSWSRLNLHNADPISCHQLKWKIFDDHLQRINGISFRTSQMIQHLWQKSKDLNELPPQTQRDQECEQHKSCLPLLEEHPLFYSFIKSLDARISVNMCHSLAVNYRIMDFQQAKNQLAQQLFNMFNHRIFHCGLQPQIHWQSSHQKSTSNFIVSGKQLRRSFNILLSESIKKPANLIETLLHEMCHVAAFIYNGEIGHGDNCQKWSCVAKFRMPELPFVAGCEANTCKYICYLCGATSLGQSIRFSDITPHLHCAYCQFELLVEPWQSHNPHFWSTKASLMTPYKEFIKENYLEIPNQESEFDFQQHNDKMLQLNLKYMKQIKK